jgi:hypothetical protein
MLDSLERELGKQGTFHIARFTIARRPGLSKNAAKMAIFLLCEPHPLISKRESHSADSPRSGHG